MKTLLYFWVFLNCSNASLIDFFLLFPAMAKAEDSAEIAKSFSSPTKLNDLSLNPFLHKENVNTMFIQYI